MKYLKFLILFCFVLFWSNFIEVNAATLGTNNVCSSTKIKTIGEGKCQDLSQAVGVTSKTDTITTTQTVEKEVSSGQDVKYYVIALIDTSTSMKAKGFTGTSYSSKVELLNTVFKKFADKIYSTTNGSVIKYIYFNTPNTLNSYSKGNNILSNSDLSGSTLTQRALKKAYDQLKNLKSSDGYTPMVVLFTDGYPNQVMTSNYSVTKSYNEKNAIGNWYSARMAYYTLLTMKTLKDNISNLKFFTFGIGMSNEDSFAKYLLLPNQENYNNLSTGSISTESKRLKSIFEKNYDGYEFVADLRSAKTSSPGSGITSNPEYGFYRGIYETAKITVKKKDKTVSVVNYDFTKSDGTSAVTSNFVNLWGSKPTQDTDIRLWFYFPNENLKKSNINKLEYSTDGGSSWTAINLDNVKKTKLYSKSVFILKKDAGTYSTTALTNIRFTFNSQITFDSNSISSPIDYTKLFDVVDASYVGDDLEGFEKMINEEIFETTITTEVVTSSTSFTKNTYEPCSDYSNLTVDDKYYVKTTVPLYKQNSSGGIDTNSATTCSPVSLNVSSIVTDEVNFNFGDIINGVSTYNGGSFSLSNISVTNKIKWYYQKISTANNPMFTLIYTYKKKKDDGSGYENMPSEVDVGFDEITLYSNSSCSRAISLSDFESSVWDEIKNNNIDDKSYNGLIQSIDTNTGKSNSNVEIVSTDHSSTIINSNIKNGSSGGILELKYEVSLPNAWLNSKTQEVIYGGNNPDSSIYLDAGYFRYTPLKYSGSLPVSLDSNFNFSIVSGINIYPAKNTSCPVNVEPRIYVPDGNDGYEFNVRYRSIDVSNPFPKSIPNNWKDWYNNSASNQLRIKNSYQNYYSNKPLYKITIGNSTDEINYDSIYYFDWTGINLKGQSEFVLDNFDVVPQGDSKNAGYCPLGYWSSECD